MGRKTKGMVEAEISNTIVKFEKEYMGRGPTEVKTYIVEDMVIVRLKGILTRGEMLLLKSEDGVDLIKKLKANLLESVSAFLYEAIKDITGMEVVSLHTDISTDTGERIIVFTMKGNLEEAIRDGSI